MKEHLREGKGPHPTIPPAPQSRSNSEVQLADKHRTYLQPGQGHTGLTMMATLENSIAERNCQTLGEGQRGQLHSHSHSPSTQIPGGGTPCSPNSQAMGGGMNSVDAIQSKAQKWRTLHTSGTQNCIQTRPAAHLSPRGSRTANFISLPKTWLICEHTSQRYQGGQPSAS